jgi:hypothetical protein
MTSKKEPPPRRERSVFVEDSIMRERVRKEMMYQTDRAEFAPSLDSLKSATPDKPLVDSFCSRLYTHPELDSEEEVQLRSTLNIVRRTLPPHDKFREPLTTSMEYGWDQYDVPSFKSIFDHRRPKTDVTTMPSKWDPDANVMTVKDRKKE